MTFTDEDLKRFKGPGNVHPIWVYGLIARLEAAEEFIRLGALEQSVNADELRAAEERWRKAAGK